MFAQVFIMQVVAQSGSGQSNTDGAWIAQRIFDVAEWLRGDTMKFVLIGVVVLLAIAVVMIIRFVSTIAFYIAAAFLLISLFTSFGTQRAAVKTCLSTCACTLFGMSVEFPGPLNYCNKRTTTPADPSTPTTTGPATSPTTPTTPSDPSNPTTPTTPSDPSNPTTPTTPAPPTLPPSDTPPPSASP